MTVVVREPERLRLRGSIGESVREGARRHEGEGTPASDGEMEPEGGREGTECAKARGT